MARTNRGVAPPHIAVIEAVLQDRVRSDLSVSLNTMYRVLRGSIPSWPVQAEIAAAISDADQRITATQLFGPRALPAWAAELIGEPIVTAVAA